MDVNEWRALCASGLVLKNRRQSLAFLRGASLHPVALRERSNHLDPGSKRKIADWIASDGPWLDQANWGAVLKAPHLDIDVDTDPRRGKRDPQYVANVIAIVDAVEAALKMAGVDYLAYGRTSMGCRGHFIVPITGSKDEIAFLANLQMAKPLAHGDVNVRIEVRRPAADKASQKNFTLPGSVRVSEVDGSLDLIQWRVLGDFREGAEMPARQPQPFAKLKLAMYGAIMLLAISPHWEEGARHHCAVAVSGAMAHEFMNGLLTEEECAAVMELLIEETGDDEAEDRLRCLTDALNGIKRGAKITGYKTLSEIIGDDWKAALLRLRGGGDPDSLSALFETAVRVLNGRTKPNCYIDLSQGAENYTELDQTHVRYRFKSRPEYPKVANAKGVLTDAIEIVIHSKHQRTYTTALTFPGVPFGSTFYLDTASNRWEEITEDDPAPAGAITGINVAAGYSTAVFGPDQKPDARDFFAARALWYRLRDHLTNSDPEQNEKLDQLLATKLQEPRVKHALGCALVGGQGIGKSFLFETMLRKLIGETLVRKSTTAELQGNYRFSGIEKILFLSVEECRFDGMPNEVRNMIKDLMRNPYIHRNEKYGANGEVSNVALPFFLSNELNPQLMFDGRADRSLVIIHGERQENLGLEQPAWLAHQRTIKAEIGEFAAALNRREIRQALLHYFLTLPLLAEITDDNELAENDDLRTGLSPPLQALVEMLETGWILPERRGDRGPKITDPFTLETLVAGIRERLRNRGTSTFTTSNRQVGILVAELFGENTRERGVHRSMGVSRARREGKVMKSVRFFHNNEEKAMYYFGFQRGRLLDIIERMRGLTLEPEYALNGAEMGLRPEPSREELMKAYAFATELSAMQQFRGLGYT